MVFELRSYDSSTLTMNGGSVWINLNAYDYATVTMSEATVEGDLAPIRQ